MAQIAQRIGLAKGTVYLYFPTKEALFLEVVWARLLEWLDVLDRGLLSLARSRRGEEVAALLSRTLRSREDLLRLLSLLPTVFEVDSDPETVLRFKRLILSRVGQTGTLIERSLPFLRHGQGGRLLLSVQAFVIGLWRMAAPRRAAEGAPSHPQDRAFQIDFFDTFDDTISALFAGLEARGRRRR